MDEIVAEPVAVLRGHAAEVTSARFAPADAAWTDSTGQPLLLSASMDGEVRIWSVHTRRMFTSIMAHPGKSVLTVSAIADRKVLSQGRDGFVRIWDVTSGALSGPLAELPSKSYNFCQAACSAAVQLTGPEGSDCPAKPPLIAMASEDAMELTVWDLRQRTCAMHFIPARREEHVKGEGKSGMCMCARFARDDTALLSGWEDGSLQVFDLRAPGAPPRTRQRIHTESMLCLDMDAAGEHALTGAADRKLCVTPIAPDGTPGEQSAQLPIPITTVSSGSGGLQTVCMRPDGRVFAAGGWDHRVRVWQWRKLKPLAVLKQHTGTVNAVTYSPCSRWLASASADGTIALWNLFPPKT